MKILHVPVVDLCGPCAARRPLLTLALRGLAGLGQPALYNALGQVVRTQALRTTAEQTMSTRSLAAGVYTLRLTVPGQSFTRKVVLE